LTDSDEVDWPILQIGINRLITTLPPKILNQGIYTIEIMASLHNREWIIEPGKNNSCILFEISGYLSSSPFWYSKRPGLIAPIIKWNNMHTNENIKNNDII
jgi:lipopolysaccharide transport system ATP-binding protein